MQRVSFLLAYPLLWLISRLPFRILYFLSDMLFFLVYRVIRYRRKVVRENLNLVFPDKSEHELRTIEKKFFAHLCDMFLEMVKTMGITRQELDRRFTFSNLEVLRSLEEQGKSVMLMFPHYASWEWVISLDPHVKGRGIAIYQPINNKYFDQWVRKVRGKFGTTLVTTRETRDCIRQNRKEGNLITYGILSDQSPMAGKARYWAPFMGITVPMHVGAEAICKQMDLPAIYLKIRKLKRGHYQGSFVLLAENPAGVPDYEITDAFFREVEKAIAEAPEYYFWTHKRWKHRNKAPAEIPAESEP
jgi:KDO2-lipid IV(A) lauroyltransferase